MNYLIKLLITAVAVTSVNSYGREEMLFRLNGNSNQLNISSQSGFVKGGFNALPKEDKVKRLCFNYFEDIYRAGPYEAQPCGSNPKMAPMGADDIIYRSKGYLLVRNFGINTNEYKANFSSGNSSYVLNSAAHQVQQALNLSTKNGYHQIILDFEKLPEVAKYKLPGTGPHIHLGKKFSNSEVFFKSGQSGLDVAARIAVPQYNSSGDAVTSIKLVLEFEQPLQNSGAYKTGTLILSVFNPIYKGLNERVSSDGRSIYLSSSFESNTSLGEAINGSTKTRKFSGFKLFRYRVRKGDMKEALERVNDYVDDEGLSDDKKFNTNPNKLKIRGFTVRNEATKLLDDKLSIRYQVDRMDIIRIFD